MPESFEGRMPPQEHESSPEVREIEQKIGATISKALEHGHSVSVEQLEDGKISFGEGDVEAGTGRQPYSESRELVYTDGKKEKGKWQEGSKMGSNPNGHTSSRTIEIDGATLVVEKHHVKNEGGRDSYEYTSYLVKAKSPDAVKEVIKSKEVPELGGNRYDYEESVLADKVTVEELEAIARELPERAEAAILDTLKKDGYVETYHLNAPSVQMTEVDETAGSGSYPYYHDETVVFTDGELKRGQKSADRGQGSNPDGGVSETRVTIRNATIVIVRDSTTNYDRNRTDKSTTLKVYSDSPEKYAKFSAKMAKDHRPEREEDEN